MKTTQSFKGKGPEAFSDIPEGYFEQLPDTVWAAIHMEKRPEHKSRQMKLLSWAAAVVLLAAVGTIWFMKPEKPETQIALNSEVSDTVKTLVMEMHQQTEGVFEVAEPKLVRNIQANETQQVQWASDSLLLDLITYEEIMEYLIDQSEFEF